MNSSALTLPREVLKWLHTLDLSHSFSNPKRDFCNGVLVAEVLSRYFVGKIQVNLLYTSESVERREDNWRQLAKFFKKQQISVPQEAMNAVLHCHPNAAVLFICNVYTLLTGKSLPEMSRSLSASVAMVASGYEATPRYTLPTTSTIIKAVGAESRSKAEAVAVAHREYLKALRKATKDTSSTSDADVADSVDMRRPMFLGD
ncbi:hypothetical protein SeMB42_g03547 [Synchytrium endobioticum]|uniref:CH-like domain-containing protein n=1 Tax=Synchytrium endobioticum TaxID=286115 RepID=A0A507CZK0_9FUNG|nr:hypothetical protein SeLEV6574_g04415 [Synchytrium endobioticum]TPX46842.1 hypothetical protein SeMB42_g03547 [Synchytrium endobioticum]